MDYTSWLRQRLQLERTATRHPEPTVRAKASKEIKKLDATRARTQ